jgi:hypothetical protein
MTAAVLLNVVDALGNVENLPSPVFKQIVKCAAAALLVEAPAANPIAAVPAKKRRSGWPLGKPRKPKMKANDIAARRAAASKRWRAKQKAKRGRGSDSAAALEGWKTRRRLKAEREALVAGLAAPAANGNAPAAANGSDAKPPPNLGGRRRSTLGNSVRALAPAKNFLREKFESAAFLPLVDLAKEARAQNINGELVGAAAHAIGARKALRGSVEGLEMPAGA